MPRPEETDKTKEKTRMLIYDELKKDHRKVLALADQLTQSEGKSRAERKKMVQEILDELVPHSRDEEAVFYNVLRALDKEDKILAHSFQEHMEVEALLRTLKAAETIDLHWKTGARKVKEGLSHHIEAEETRLFK